MSIAWIYKLSSIWTWRFSLNVNLGAMMYSEYPKYWSSCQIPRNESSIFTVWLPRKTNYFGGLLAEGPAFEKRDQFSWLHNFSKSWLVNWKICLISRPTKICPVPRQEDGAFEGESLTEFGSKKSPGAFVLLNWWKIFWSLVGFEFYGLVSHFYPPINSFFRTFLIKIKHNIFLPFLHNQHSFSNI